MVYNISMKVGDTMSAITSFIDSSGILLRHNAIRGGVKKDEFYQFVAENNFEKVAKGVYLSPESWEDAAFVLHRRCPQAVFSHDEALFYHGLIDREPMQPTITIYSGYNPQSLKASGVKVFTVKKELLAIGRREYQNSFGHTIPVYDLERTICDLIRSRSHFEFQDLQRALKSYVARADKDINKLMTYAPLFRIEKQVWQYLELLL